MELGRYSFGVGDRFGHQGKAQLAAVMKAKEQGLDVTPVWNKSNREHQIIGTQPTDVRREADAAVAAAQWDGPYFVDADHIGLTTVDPFLDGSDFFTLDVADYIGQVAEHGAVNAFVDRHRDLIGSFELDGINVPLEVTEARVEVAASKHLLAVQKAAEVYRYVESQKGTGNFVTEVSMDETDAPQTPMEMLVILAALADEGVPAQTIAPKFSGRFNKGVDYVGDLEQFTVEFEQDLAVIRFAVERFGLPAGLKLSVHSGSDKFSIYGPINRALKKFDTGLHLKTAGTTWLEELIGLALAGDDGLAVVRAVCAGALARIDELCEPYETVIDIGRNELPTAAEVESWDGERLAATLRHDPSEPTYNPNFRQLLHVGYKVAAEMGPRFVEALRKHESTIAPHVTANIYDRHIKPLYLGQ